MRKHKPDWFWNFQTNPPIKTCRKCGKPESKHEKNIQDDGREPIDNIDIRAMNEHYNKRYYAPSGE